MTIKTIVIKVAPRRVAPRNRISITIINVKPYWVIMCGTKIMCGGRRELPIVFDTSELALLYKHDYSLKKGKIIKMELEELARKCRDIRVPFDSFILIDKPSQLGMD